MAQVPPTTVHELPFWPELVSANRIAACLFGRSGEQNRDSHRNRSRLAPSTSALLIPVRSGFHQQPFMNLGTPCSMLLPKELQPHIPLENKIKANRNTHGCSSRLVHFRDSLQLCLLSSCLPQEPSATHLLLGTMQVIASGCSCPLPGRALAGSPTHKHVQGIHNFLFWLPSSRGRNQLST